MSGPDTKPSLLFINRTFPPDAGASALRLFELVQGLADKGWRITVLTNRGRGRAPLNMHPNIRLVRLPFGDAEKKPNALQHVFWIVALALRAIFLPRHDVTATVTDPPMAHVIGTFVQLFKRTRVVHWVHDLYPHLFPVMGVRLPLVLPLLRCISTVSLRAQDRIVVIGDDTGALLEKDGVPAAKISVVPNWPDVLAAMIEKKKPARHDSQNPFILEGVFTVLYSGNFGLVHDFEPLIEAIKIVHQSPHPIRFIFAGDGRKFTTVRNSIEQMMLTNVHFIRAQPREKFMDMLLAGDLHVATMVPEAAGLVAPSKINSALGLGRPCLFIGPKNAFQAQLIQKFGGGVVIDPTDSHAKFLLADAIIEYATKPERYEAAQQNALKAADSIGFDKALTSFDVLLHAEADKATR